MKKRFLNYLPTAVWLLLLVTLLAAADQGAPVIAQGLSVEQIIEMEYEELKVDIETELGYGVEKWRENAEQMTPTQQYAIAELYLYGEVTGDVLRDREEAMFWLLKSAHRGLPAAQFRLGAWCDMPTSIYALEHLITQTPEEAFHWYKLAAEAGYARAFAALGNAYKHGRGCEKDLQSAKYWLTRAVLECRSAYALEALYSLINEEELQNILRALAEEP